MRRAGGLRQQVAPLLCAMTPGKCCLLLQKCCACTGMRMCVYACVNKHVNKRMKTFSVHVAGHPSASNEWHTHVKHVWGLVTNGATTYTNAVGFKGSHAQVTADQASTQGMCTHLPRAFMERVLSISLGCCPWETAGFKGSHPVVGLTLNEREVSEENHAR
eukprot:541020-Pelagomonas_calceolata.AAC.2